MSEMKENQNEYGNDILTLTDDDGNTLELEHLDTLEYQGDTYMAFIPAEMSVEDEYELMILRVEPEEGTGEEILATIEDEDLLQTVFQIFSERLENYFEEQEQEELSREGY
jgi:uncharacterized protein YrzB (UPF0473 family)